MEKQQWNPLAVLTQSVQRMPELSFVNEWKAWMDKQEVVVHDRKHHIAVGDMEAPAGLEVSDLGWIYIQQTGGT